MRVTFLVDGFNLYHSAVELSTNLGGASTKWLDLRGMLSSLLPNIAREAKLEEIYFFSALAHHREPGRPGTVKRHENYIKCLESTGVKVELGRFKRRTTYCKHCSKSSKSHAEKETDVAIAMKLVELLSLEQCDLVMLVTGDTDLAPAVRTARALYRKKKLGFVFPYKRKHDELTPLADYIVRLKKNRYLDNQFPDPFIISPGVSISKPPHW